MNDHIKSLTTALELAGALDQAPRLGRELHAVLSTGGRVLAAGNGGSAAQAQHLTAELVGRYHRERRAFAGVCLSSETSTLTALLNDYPPEEIFARQVQAHGRAGDVLVLFSTSGSSANVLAAARTGRELGLRVWGLTGPAGNPLGELCDELIAIEADNTATVQEMHLVGLHLICEGFDETFFDAQAGMSH